LTLAATIIGRIADGMGKERGTAGFAAPIEAQQGMAKKRRGIVQVGGRKDQRGASASSSAFQRK
jgi:hypothetical protein